MIFRWGKPFPPRVEDVMASGSVGQGAPDALTLRKSIYGDRDPQRSDLDDLIARGPEAGADPDFCALVAEVATDVLVRQVDPEGYVTEADAAWLIARLGERGGLDGRAEFEALKAVLSHAVSVPPALTAFAVREIEKAILTGSRDALGATEHPPGIVTADDVEALRAFVFAPTRGSSLHVDRATAEALFDIAHATAAAENAPGFADLFARAVGNHLMGVAFLGTPDPGEVLRHEAALAEPTSFGGFLSAMRGRASRATVADAMESVDEDEEEVIGAINAETDRRLAAASVIDSNEAKWVLAHLGRGGDLTLAEKRLLAFLRDEASSAPPEIRALYGKAA
jgi:hypothetical protein